ncbi:DoxX family protein [Duganella sp. Root1480D1]|uniref:DoxX family protein n=1 Tax=Duganella sp. Root1480D1 TaxID=1736471 RepID=UPI000710805E|nr:DoxX family protein [Duganella sp. Root1480D1]KQZ44085.1 LysR family transcriptional regulator [Duganella sp. Root1480D1]
MNNQTNAAVLPLIGRILMAAIFVMSGIGKIANPGTTLGYINAMGLPFPELALVGAIGIEVVGGLLLVAGLYTRPVALALAGFSILTGLVFHSAIADQNQMIHLMKNLAMAGGLLQIAAFGAGSLSIDARRIHSALRTA